MEDKKNNEQVVTLEELEKSWNDSKAALRELLGIEEVQKSTPDDSTEEKKGEDLEKSEDKKEKPEDDKTEDEDSEDEEDEEEEEEAEKSLEDFVSADSDAEAAMDVEPFLRQLVKGLDERFEALAKSLQKVATESAGNSKAQKALGKALSDLGDQQMLIANTVEAVAGQPVPSRSVLRKSRDRFETTNEANDLSMDRETILEKALKLRTEGKLESLDVTKIENRLNKGMDLPENYKKILKEAN